MKIKTARFWMYHREGFVRLALQDGQQVEFYTGGPHEEGFTHCMERYSRVGDVINYERHDWGRDCDGAYSTNYESHCPVDQLAANTDGGYDGKAPPRPAWVKGESSQYDESAVMAGY